MENNFSPQESLLLIQQMINKTKADMSGNRFYFLLWGWIAFVAIMGQFVLKVLLHNPYHYMVWLIIFIGMLWSIVYTKNKHRKSRVKTFVGDTMKYLWIGLGISFFVLSFIISKNTWLYSYPFFIMLYGLGTFVSGHILQFRPLVIGGIINWVLAIVSTYFSFDYQMLFAAAAIWSSYLIPGYMLKTNV